MKTQILLTLTAIKALILTASKDSRRPALTGLFVSFETRQPTVIGCDGHVLLAYKLEFDVAGDTSFLIPSDALAFISKLPKKKHEQIVGIDFDPEAKAVVVTVEQMSATFEASDHAHCDFFILPCMSLDEPSGEPAQFAPAIIAQVAKVVALVTGSRDCKAMKIVHNGRSHAAIIDMGGQEDRWYMIAMPKQANPPTCTRTPDWCRKRIETEVEAA